MKTWRSSSLLFVSLFIVLISLTAFYPVTAAAQAKPALTNDDCAKCHQAPPADLAAEGGKHREVGCTGCHIGHPPTVKKPIPQCSDCHMGKAHFELKGCLGCHKNPHKPLNISFAGNVTDACVTCHTSQIKQLRDNKSKHTALACSSCHDVHGKKPQCTQCHKPHSPEMPVSECKKCHKAHMPKAVTYADDIPSKDCASCHTKAFDLLLSGKTKHKSFACAFCHQQKHKMVPSCQGCHGSPHPEGIMRKFPKCGDCHNIAHDLNNWPASQQKQPPKKKSTGKKKK
jgi:hypothetical protein